MLRNIILKNAWALLAICVLFSSCDSDDNDGAGAQVALNSFGPSVLRGGELKFIGNNLNKVTAVVLPDNIEIPSSAFTTHTAELISIDVPDEAVEGLITLKTEDGDIVTKTPLSILEPITITGFPSGPVRPGDVITIEGTYLNLINEVIFATNKSVTDFESQSRTSLSVRVPDDAQSGVVVLLDSEEIPNEIETETELLVTLPSVTGITPATVKAGNTITVDGSDLDLVTAIEFGGSQIVDSADFVSQSASQIVVAVPADTRDGNITVVAPSLLRTESTVALTMVVPEIASVTPIPAKTGGEITVTGTDLDLISEVVFAGNKTGVIKSGGSATSITVEVPDDAQSGAIEFRTRAGKSASSAAVEMTKPAITDMTTEVKLNEQITITGTNLDIVKEVRLSGGTTGEIESGSTDTQLIVTVPLGTTSGTLSLIADNGDEITSASELVILAEVPEFDSFPAQAKPGTLLTLTGEKLNLTNEVIFPGDVTATRFGDRTSTTLEVYVPEGVEIGSGKITFTTYGTDVTESAPINFSWADPVQNPDLVFFNFNGTGSKDSWWGSASLVADDKSLDGTKYGSVNGSFNGWTDLFWRNSANNFPGATVGANVDDYVVKFDINVFQPIADGNIKMRLQDNEGGDFWYAIGPDAPPSHSVGVVEVTPGWVTITIPISSFKDNYGWGSNTPTDMSLIDTFGMAFDNGSSTVDFAIDNVRFELK